MSLDAPQLKTASTYINNLLLARGLLRNGKAIDFAALAATDRRDTGNEQDTRKGTAKKVERAAEVINLVHDLILRRDRETDQFTSLSETLTELRATTTTQNSQIDRLKAQNQDLTRQIHATQSSAKSVHAALTATESSAKALKEEFAKVKAILAQVRTQCANDVRKRDVQIQRLKGHLSSSQRGSNGRTVGPSCTINPGSIVGKGSALGLAIAPGSGGTGSGRTDEETPPNLEDVGYSLKQETTEFLTQLSQTLSDENDSLISLIKGTLTTLRELQNLPPDDVLGIRGHGDQESDSSHDDLVQVVPTAYVTLSTDLEYVLTNLRVILTNASFVPIEEVYARDEEINRLREGWERMESRWREAVEMMKGWRERMLSGGGAVNLEELKLGMGLGEGLEHLDDFSCSPPASSVDEGLEEGDDEIPYPPEDEPSFTVEEEEEALVFRPKSDADDHLFDNVERSSSPLGPPPVSAALKESTANVNMLPPKVPAGSYKARPLQENISPSKAISDDSPSAECKTSSASKFNAAAKIDDIQAGATDGDRSEARGNSSLTSSPRVSAQPTERRLSKAKPRASKVGSKSSTSRSNIRHVSTFTPTRVETPQPASPAHDTDPPLSVEQKLRHAEAEARRISGSSLDMSQPPSPTAAKDMRETRSDTNRKKDPVNKTKNDHQDSPEDSEEPQAQPPVHDPTTTNTGNTTEPKRRRPEANPNGSATSNSSRTLPSKTRATASTAASRAGTLPRRGGHTLTTRVPTKPAAPDAPTTRRKAAAAARGTVGTVGGPSVVEEAMKRSRRKRKSTLSPEELEELMGLRTRAEAEAEAKAEAEAVVKPVTNS